MNIGRHSILNRIHGALRAIHEQAKDKSSFSFEDAKTLMKFLAAQYEGYPKVKERVRFRGKIIIWERPASLSGQSDAVAMILWNTIAAFADERGLYIFEYKAEDSDEIYRSVGGRSFDDMKPYIADIRKEAAVLKMAGRDGEAAILSAKANKLEEKPRESRKEIEIW